MSVASWASTSSARTAFGLVLAAALLAASTPALALDGWRIRTKSAEDFIAEGDRYAEQYRFGLAAEAYKIAIKKDPENTQAWERHRRALEQGKVVSDLVQRGQHHLKAGEYEDAARVLRQAVQLNPRDDSVWRLYESALHRNPNVVLILDEREAWEAFKKGKALFEADRLEDAKLYFSRVRQSTRDPSLVYYAESYLKRTEDLQRRHYPNAKVHIRP